jgi:hypothetical protein
LKLPLNHLPEIGAHFVLISIIPILFNRVPSSRIKVKRRLIDPPYLASWQQNDTKKCAVL